MTDLVLDSGLDSLLNQFSVPMFALDRSAPKDEFQYVCINRALEVAGARPAADVVGRSVHQLLPKLEADIVHRRYAECAETRKDVRFRDQFTAGGHPVIWDTTLQHVALKDGSDRLVGTCIRLSEERDHTGKAPALEDIQ